ncbi:MAG: phage tail tube protein [Marinobacter sp.]
MGGETEDLAISTKRPFQFIDGSVSVADADYAEITSFTLNYNNNLETDQFVMNGDDRQAEIEPQKREITLDMETRYSTTTNETRSTYFKTGSSVAIEATFESTEEI